MTSDNTPERICELGVSAALSSGANYADARLVSTRTEHIQAREDKLKQLTDNTSFGLGIRVLVDGVWGFSATTLIGHKQIESCAALACEVARANQALARERVTLTPIAAQQDTWRTPIRVDPFAVPLREKIEKLLHLNAVGLKHKADFCDSFLWSVKEEKWFSSSENSQLHQTLYRVWCETNPTLVDGAKREFESRKTFTTPAGCGYEYVLDFPFEEEIETACINAARKLKSRSVTPGKRDLILLPSHLWLTIHETCGHATELDRALGFEANYAGTSFLTPEKLGNLQYGSEAVTIVADRSQAAGLATCAYDDDGVPTCAFPIIERGLFVNYQTNREQPVFIGGETSRACAYSDSFCHVPIQRMPNISLRPGQRKLSLQDLIADTEDAILIKGDGSYSIDQQRSNFQFSGQEFWEVKDGCLGGMLRDVAYQGSTVSFWNSCDAICDESEYALAGSFYCGKGQPGQLAPVSHGSSPARFRGVNIINTKVR